MSYHTSKDSISQFMTALQKQPHTKGRGSPMLWEEYVGEKIAANSTILDITNGYLAVEVNHVSFKQLIQLKSSSILNKLNKRYPALKVKEIYIKVVDKPIVKKQDKPITSLYEEVEEPKIVSEDFSKLMTFMKKQAEGDNGQS